MAELGDKAMALMKPDYHPREYVALLSDKKLFPDAVRFLAHALPKREAVWWGWISARRSAGPSPPPLDQSRAGSHRDLDRAARRREPPRGARSRQGGRSRNLCRLRGPGRIFQRRQPRPGACARQFRPVSISPPKR